MPKYQYHLIYETVNMVNGKYYRGKHSTDNPDDGYLGSGFALKEAIRKYGEENFKTRILFCAFDEESVFSAEEQFVTEEEVKDPNCYNQRTGGEGSRSFDMAGEKNPMFGVTGKNHHLFGIRGEQSHTFGFRHSEETKRRISEANAGSNHPWARQVVVEGKLFSTRKEAGEFHGVSPVTIRLWIKSGKKGAYYADGNGIGKQPTFEDENNPRSRSVIIQGQRFVSLKEASKYFQVDSSTIGYWVKSEYIDANYEDNQPIQSPRHNSGKNNKQSKPVEVNGVKFDTIKDACEYFGILPKTLRDWIKKDKHGAYFIDDK